MSNLFFFLLLAGFYAIELFFIGPVDGINDDWGMYSILSGAYTGAPDAHVMFFLYPLSWVFTKLYSLCSFIPWYGIFQHGVQIGSLYAVYQRTLRIRKKHDPEKYRLPVAFVTFLLLFFIVNLNVLSEAQYTTTAGLAAAAALFCFTTSRSNQGKKRFFLDNIPTFLLAWTAFSMRQNIFYLCLPMAGMLWLSKWVLSRRNRHENTAFKLLGFALILGAGMGILWSINAAAYASPEWSDFRKINHYRERVGDFYSWPEYEECKDDLTALGIDEETYYYRRNGAPCIGYDMSVSDWEQMHRIAKKCYLARVDSRDRLKRIVIGLVNTFFYEDGMQPANLLAGLLLLFTLGLILFQRNGQALFVYLMYLFGRTVSWCYVLYEGRFPKRIVQPLITIDYMILFAILLAFNLLQLDRARKFVVTLSIILPLCALSFSITRTNVQENYRVHQETWEGLKNYCFSHPDNFYIWTYASGTLEHFCETPFSMNQDVYQNFIYTNWGVMCNPNTQKKLSDQGIGDFGQDLVDSDHVYFILQDAPFNQEHPVLLYFRHTYHAEIRVADTFTAGDTSYCVYQLYPL